MRYPDEVLQVEDSGLVESVLKGRETPALTPGRIASDLSGLDWSEHAVHDLPGLVLDAYAKAAS